MWLLLARKRVPSESLPQPPSKHQKPLEASDITITVEQGAPGDGLLEMESVTNENKAVGQSDVEMLQSTVVKQRIKLCKGDQDNQQPAVESPGMAIEVSQVEKVDINAYPNGMELSKITTCEDRKEATDTDKLANLPPESTITMVDISPAAQQNTEKTSIIENSREAKKSTVEMVDVVVNENMMAPPDQENSEKTIVIENSREAKKSTVEMVDVVLSEKKVVIEKSREEKKSTIEMIDASKKKKIPKCGRIRLNFYFMGSNRVYSADSPVSVKKIKEEWKGTPVFFDTFLKGVYQVDEEKYIQFTTSELEIECFYNLKIGETCYDGFVDDTGSQLVQMLKDYDFRSKWKTGWVCPVTFGIVASSVPITLLCKNTRRKYLDPYQKNVASKMSMKELENRFIREFHCPGYKLKQIKLLDIDSGSVKMNWFKTVKIDRSNMIKTKIRDLIMHQKTFNPITIECDFGEPCMSILFQRLCC